MAVVAAAPAAAPDSGSVAENTTLSVDAAHGILANDSAPAGESLTRYSVLRADGRPIPDWMSSSGQGLFIGQHPVDVERIDLRIVATFADGSSITRYVSIDTTTGEIKPLKDRHANFDRPKTLSRQFASLEHEDFDHRALTAALLD